MPEIDAGGLRHFVGAGLVDGRVGLAIVGHYNVVLEHPGFHFLAADVGEHLAVDFHAGAEHLAAFLDHLLPLQGVVDDVAVLVGQVVFAQDGAHALAPAAGGFQISNDFRLTHNL
jgi:hypothetical protein